MLFSTDYQAFFVLYIPVILLAISKHEPQKTPWTSSKRLKQQRTNENTSVSEEAKVGLTNEALAIILSWQKDRVRRRERFCENLGT